MIDLGIVIRLVDDETDPDVGHVVYDVIEPESGYLVERFHDLMKAVEWAAVPKCQVVHYGYPHPGCAEFAPPDEIPCGGYATRRVAFVDRVWDFGEEVMYLCDTHAQEIGNEGVEIVSDGPLPVRDLA